MRVCRQFPPKERAAVDAGFGVLSAIARQWPGTTEHNR